MLRLIFIQLIFTLFNLFKCCGCFGPAGETKEFCAHECKPLNGGTITTNVYTWFWVRSALPKSLWKKCMEYKVTKNSDEEVWYKLLGSSSVPTVVCVNLPIMSSNYITTVRSTSIISMFSYFH